MTPAERARAWYPAASIGGGNNEANFKGVGNKFLWKPVSDSTKKAAVHTPAGVRIASLTVGGKTYPVGSYGNGFRPLFRLDKPGSAYGANVQVTMNLYSGGTITVTVPNGAQRFEKSGFKDSDSAPAQPTAPAPVASINLPASYAAKVGLVAAIQGRKFHSCTRDPANPARWTHPGKQAGLYGVRWNVRPPGSVAAYNAVPFGLWSVTDGTRFLTIGEILVQLMGIKDDDDAPQVVTPSPPAAPVKPDEPLFSRDDATLTLRADFAAVVGKVDALANIHETAPGAVSMGKLAILPATRSGNTWTIAKPLGTYPVGNRPNTWRIRLKGKPPAGVTYHTSIMQSFIREGDFKTYPPTTRK